MVSVTEGFGRIPGWRARRSSLLKARARHERASLNGATQIRAGVIRPEVVVPPPDDERRAVRPGRGVVAGGLSPRGTRVRIIREPHFGRLGRVTRAAPGAPAAADRGTSVRVLVVDLEGGAPARVTLPQANVEIIES